jgi:GNAT superfamily N-acetyltransferase
MHLGGSFMQTKIGILEIAKAQMALDFNCHVSDFVKSANTISENKLVIGRRLYDSDGCFFKALCFCGRTIISASPEIIPWCEQKLVNSDSAWFFEYSHLKWIDKKLQVFGHEIADVHHYYLPNPNALDKKPITTIKWYEYEEILQFEDDDRFNEAFAFNDNHPDMLAVAALDGDAIMGMAGASSDGRTLWQIGIDVFPGYRGRGIGTNLTSLLKNELLTRGKIPFYGTVESHIHSQNIAVNAGFFPAWAEVYSKAIK